MDTKDQNLNFCELKADNMEGTVGAAIIVTKTIPVKKTCIRRMISPGGITAK